MLQKITWQPTQAAVSRSTDNNRDKRYSEFVDCVSFK
jgi:hypothetical protein